MTLYLASSTSNRSDDPRSEALRLTEAAMEKGYDMLLEEHIADFSEQMEVRENRRELEQVMDAAIDAVTQETDEQQPVQDVSKQKHGQERQ